LEAVRRTLGPSGGWFARDKVIGKVPMLLGRNLVNASVKGDRVHLQLESADGKKQEILADHVIAATGYKVDLNRLEFLSKELREKVRVVDKAPILSKTFESSAPGLYFAGVSAAYSFGPVMRFAFGAGFAARTISRAIAESLSREPAVIPVRSVVGAAE
jgi:thioredoxin reductase